MGDESWQQARLIPTSGINGPDEAERRGTSALLAVMGAVREFGLAVLRPYGAPAGHIETYIEVPFKLAEQTVIPDGVVQSTRGGTTWSALVEVKTGAAELHSQQVEAYLDVARDHDFDAVLTISNQLAPAPGVHPVNVDRRKLRRVDLHHLSWAEILTIAVQQRVHYGVADPEQAWILGELIRYLEHPKSGALDFSDMGGAWVGVRESIVAGTLRSNDKGLPEVVSRWEQLLRFAALRLGRELGADVQVHMTRREMTDPSLRIASQLQGLCRTGALTGTLRIPDAVAPLDITADLHAGRVTVSAAIDAPRNGRNLTRVNWLVRQLRDAPGGLRIDAHAVSARTSLSELLAVVRENPASLIADSKRELRAFRIAATSPVGAKRGAGRGGFIDSVLAAIDGFYEAALQQVRPWTAKAPQLPREGRSAVEEAGIEIEPPEQDLVEATDSTLVEAVPPDAPTPDIVVAAQQPLAEPSPVSTGGRERVPVSDPLVSWETAQERLDRERELAAPVQDSS